MFWMKFRLPVYSSFMASNSSSMDTDFRKIPYSLRKSGRILRYIIMSLSKTGTPISLIS